MVAIFSGLMSKVFIHMFQVGWIMCWINRLKPRFEWIVLVEIARELINSNRCVVNYAWLLINVPNAIKFH